MVDEIIKPLNTKEEFILEDKDYLLIKALRDLTNEIRKLRGVL